MKYLRLALDGNHYFAILQRAELSAGVPLLVPPAHSLLLQHALDDTHVMSKRIVMHGPNPPKRQPYRAGGFLLTLIALGISTQFQFSADIIAPLFLQNMQADVYTAVRTTMAKS